MVGEQNPLQSISKSAKQIKKSTGITSPQL